MQRAQRKKFMMVCFTSDHVQGGLDISRNPPGVNWCNTLRYCTLHANPHIA